MLTWWLYWRVPALLLVVMAAWWFGYRPVVDGQEWVSVTDDFILCGARGERADGCVIDGDTVVIGFGSAQRRIRLTGFDAPEIEGACDRESRLAREARAELKRWLAAGRFEWNGGDNPPRDRYGRELRVARRIAADGTREELAKHMLSAGLASETGWGATERDWCR